ncbi:MAG: hypothetical protein M1822_003430 [Bathelium mastoideum]|nr:MAG: hypothetical protein M1822_003430 [Bathelium mastoideum]
MTLELDRTSLAEEAPSTWKNPLSMPESLTELVDIIQKALRKYKTRSAIISATQTLQDLVIGPAGTLENIHAKDMMCLQAIYRYNVAGAFGPNEEITFSALSEAVGLNVVDLKRIMRLAMTRRIFQEPRPGVVSHTAASRLLQEDSRAHAFAGIVTEERFQASAKAVDALEQYGRSRGPEHSGFSLANNTNRGLYEELEKHPDRRQRWTLAMSAMASRINLDFIFSNFAWDRYAKATIVDVGGGDGTISIALAERLSDLNFRFIVQDLPETISKIQCMPRPELRIEYQPHDFFALQTFVGADVYYFRNIFHNWPDEQCIQILRSHVPIMRPETRLLIDDFALHEPLTVPPCE